MPLKQIEFAVAPQCAALELTGTAYAHTSNVVTTLTSEITLYQDAVPQAVSNAMLSSAPPAGVLSIASSPAGGERLNGAIDEVRVWTIARTEQQIADNYTVSLAGTEPDLMAYYRLDEGRGAVAHDAAGNHPITLYNAPRWATRGR